jgi:hypothetical protein
MGMVRGKVVWILGAGFSKSLGGRLLPELLSEKSQAETKSKFGDTPYSRPYEVFRKHFRGDASNQGARNGKPVYWEHAEEFLDFVDTAARGNNVRRDILANALEGSIEGLYEECVRVIAAECEIASTVDVSDHLTTPEAWLPYVKWFQGIKPDDAAVTFNYDTVLEKLGEAPFTRFIGKETVYGVQGFAGPECALAPIYKMHGSVDWAYPVSDGEPMNRVDPLVLLRAPKPPLIATPGPTKRLNCTTVLKDIWKNAIAALKSAEVVVFVGYRFPPSDAESRTRLLAALRDNENGKGLRVHTVLGPNVNDGDTVRLRELLRSTLSEKMVEQPDSRREAGSGSFQVLVHPLYAEDFFTVFHDNMLYGHSL